MKARQSSVGCGTLTTILASKPNARPWFCIFGFLTSFFLGPLNYPLELNSSNSNKILGDYPFIQSLHGVNI